MQSKESRYYHRNRAKILANLKDRKNTDGKDRFESDESGQLWCYTKRGRVRAKVLVCEKCGGEFPTRHNQRFCSSACRSASQKGVARTDKRAKCKFCGDEFLQPIRRTKTKCCSKRCAWNLKSQAEKGRWAGAKNPRWNGGKKHMSTGYVLCYIPGKRHMLEHRFVMEQILGRPLERYEEVHHKNGIRNDNRPENLELWAKRQPGGQRVADLIEYARWVLETYGAIEKKMT